MINTIGTRGIQHSTMQGMLGNDVSVSGTGEFDFLNYLLGLQVAPTDVATDLNVLSLNTGEKTQNQDEPVLSLFDKKGSELVNPLLVGTPQITDNKTAKPIELTGKETFLENKEGDVKVERNIQSTTSQYDFQKRMLLESDVKTEVQGPKDAKEVKVQQKVEFTGGSKPADAGYDKMQKAALETKQQQNVQDSSLKSKTDLTENTNDLSNVVHNSGTTKEKFEVLGTEKKRSKDDDVDLLSSSVDSGASQLQGIQTELSVDKHKPVVSHKPATVPEMFSKVESMVHSGGGKMTITLNPPSLGQVEVKVTTRGKNVEIEMKSSNDFAKSALESHVAELKTSMQSQDLVLQKLDVQVNSDWNRNLAGGQYSQNQQSGNPYQQQSGFKEFQNNAKSSFGNNQASQAVGPVSTRQEWKPASVAGRVDIRV